MEEFIIERSPIGFRVFTLDPYSYYGRSVDKRFSCTYPTYKDATEELHRSGYIFSSITGTFK